jgi:Rrf2 family protein
MNTRFAVATHLLSFLSVAGERLVTSDQVAASVNTHPALLRRLLSSLRAAGLVETQLGPGGGARLAKPAAEITLLEVYRAVERDDDLFALGRLSPNPECPMGAHIRDTLESVLAAPQEALRHALAQVTIREVCQRAAGALSASGQLPDKQPCTAPGSIL